MKVTRSGLIGCSLLAASALFYTGAASAQGCPSTEVRYGEIMGYRASSDVLILAHRGYWGANNPRYPDTPENSIGAIDAANRNCLDGIELDIKTSSDNIPHLMHDFHLGRTTNYAEVVYRDRWYDPYRDGTNPRYNPQVSTVTADTLSRVILLTPDRRFKTGEAVPRLSNVMNQYVAARMTVPIVFDVKTSAAVKATHDVVTSIVPNALYKMGMKVNATLYQTSSAFYKDAPHMYPLPIFQTNMLGSINVDTVFNNWFGVNAIEIDVKQPHGLLYTYKDRVVNAGKRASVFQAIPDESRSRGTFFKNTGECCYKLSDIYYTWKPGYADTEDRRGDPNFLYQERLNLITTDDPNNTAKFFASKGKRQSHPKSF